MIYAIDDIAVKLQADIDRAVDQFKDLAWLACLDVSKVVEWCVERERLGLPDYWRWQEIRHLADIN